MISQEDQDEIIQSYRDHLPAAPPETLANFKVGDYLLFNPLGHGGMAAAFVAIDTKMWQRVVVKLPLVKYLYDTEATNLFKQEQQGVIALGKHENIVFFDQCDVFNTENGLSSCYLALEYVCGRSLKEKIEAWKFLPQREVCRIGIEICRGLTFIHGDNFTHRDIKPENIMLDALEGEKVRIIDLGLVADNQIGSTTIAGTIPYMAPERFDLSDSDRANPQIDLFSLGCVLYEALIGEKADPYRGYRPGHGIPQYHTPEWPSRFRSNLNSKLCVLIGNLMAENQSDRPDSARVVEIKLAEIQKILTIEYSKQWPQISSAELKNRVMQIGQELEPLKECFLNSEIAVIVGLMKRRGFSKSIFDSIEQLAGTTLLLGVLSECKKGKGDSEEVKKSLQDLKPLLSELKKKLVITKGKMSHLPHFCNSIDELITLVNTIDYNFEEFLAKHFLKLGNRYDKADLEKRIWSHWIELEVQSYNLIKDQLFVMDRLVSCSCQLRIDFTKNEI